MACSHDFVILVEYPGKIKSERRYYRDPTAEPDSWKEKWQYDRLSESFEVEPVQAGGYTDVSKTNCNKVPKKIISSEAFDNIAWEIAKKTPHNCLSL
jgi:hypothetical protein